MKIETGSVAPNFSLFDSNKQQFLLADECRDQNVLLLFFPAAFSSTCTSELNDVSNDLDSYAGTQVVGISTDSPYSLAEFRKVNNLNIRLLSDHDAIVCQAYGSKYDHDFTPMKLDRIARRSAFVIDRNRVVQYAEVLADANDLPDLDAIKKKLATLS